MSYAEEVIMARLEAAMDGRDVSGMDDCDLLGEAAAAEVERCEWDPANDKPAQDDTGCANTATICVGSRETWHLCDSCAALPRFSRFRKRTTLRVKEVKRDD